MARGDVTVHDEWVVHGSGGNYTDGTRRTYVLAYRNPFLAAKALASLDAVSGGRWGVGEGLSRRDAVGRR